MPGDPFGDPNQLAYNGEENEEDNLYEEQYEVLDNQTLEYKQQSVMSAASNASAQKRQHILSSIGPEDMHLRKALQVNPKYVDKNIYETLDRLHSYDIHQKRLNKYRD